MIMLLLLMAYYIVASARATRSIPMSEAAAQPAEAARPVHRRVRRTGAATPGGARASWRCSRSLYLVWSIVPILIAIRFSFNEGRSRSTAQGWSRSGTRRPGLSVRNDPDLAGALIQSLSWPAWRWRLPCRSASSRAGVARWRGRVAAAGNFVALFPLITPEIVMGPALFLRSSTCSTFIDLGTVAQMIGHVTFSISFVLIIVRGRLLSIGKDYEEAAQDLGASPWQSLRMALLPLLSPAIVASLIIVFASRWTTS